MNLVFSGQRCSLNWALPEDPGVGQGQLVIEPSHKDKRHLEMTTT